MTKILCCPDNWGAFVALIAHQVSPKVTITQLNDALGVGALYAMSEEWWDPSVIDMVPRMQVGFIPALYAIRDQQLQRIRALGIDMHMTWYHANDPKLGHNIANLIGLGHIVGLYGVTPSMSLRVCAVDASSLTCSDTFGNESTLHLQRLRAPAGVFCVSAHCCQINPYTATEELRWLVQLLNGLPTIAFDTLRHPLRDWQVWHTGVDAFAVAALSAETAAPLAIVSDNVARIIYAYIWRIDWLQQQLIRISHSIHSTRLDEAIDACNDVRFFLNIVAQQYPLDVARRALSLPEGTLIAEACRDTRQALRSIADMLGGSE